MKAKNIMILAMMVIAAVSQTDARQVYIYRSGMELPDTLSSDKLYFTPMGDDYIYGETPPKIDALTLIECDYNATAQSAFLGAPDEEWTVSITRDEAEENKVWIHPICLVGGLSASSVYSVYAFVDTIQHTITVPLGQMLVYSDIVLANLRGVTTGNLIADYTEESGAVSITFREGYGVPVPEKSGYWYQALSAPVYNKESLHNSVSNVDSISITPPALWVKGFSVMDQNILDIHFTTPIAEEILLLDPDVFYKAYDENNVLVHSGQVGLILTYVGSQNLRIVMSKMALDESMSFIYYKLDSFLPCDTVFKVAVSLPEALFTDQYGSVSPAVESYIDADGTEHGICYTYYNARPRLLSDGELSVDAENPRTAYLEFNEPMGLYDEMKDIKYKLYKTTGQAGAELVSEGTLVYDMSYVEKPAVSLPDTETLETDVEYIVTVSVDSWGYGDSNISTPLPSSVESYVDAEGTPHGLWWCIDWEAPYIVSPYHLEASRNGRSVTMEFNRSIVRDNTMGAISYDVLVEEAGEARTVYQGNFPEENITVEGRTLTVTLPESVAFERRVKYVILLSLEEGAVEDVYGTKMEAIVNEMQEDGQPAGPWWYVNRPILDEFFQEGEYTFDMMFYNGSDEFPLSTTANFSYVGDFDISGWGKDFTGITAKEWRVSGFLDGLIQGITPIPFSAFNYEMIDLTPVPILAFNCEIAAQRDTTECMTMIAASGDAPLTIAQYQGQDVYLVNYVESEWSLYPNVEFVVTTDPDLGEIAVTTSECPALAIQDEEGYYYIIATLDDMQFYPSDSLQGKFAKNGVLKATVVPTHIDGVKMGGLRKNTIK